jgi:hypothetical protein
MGLANAARPNQGQQVTVRVMQQLADLVQFQVTPKQGGEWDWQCRPRTG